MGGISHGGVNFSLWGVETFDVMGQIGPCGEGEGYLSPPNLCGDEGRSHRATPGMSMFDILQFEKRYASSVMCHAVCSAAFHFHVRPWTCERCAAARERESCHGTPSFTATENVDSDACTVVS